MKYFLTAGTFVLISSALAQIPEYVPSEGLVAWQSFQGDAQDASGNGNHGVSETPPSFEYDSYWDAEVAFFDDIDDELVVPSPAQLGMDNQISFALWVKPTSETHGQAVSMDAGRFSFYLAEINQNFDAVSTSNWASGTPYCGFDNAHYLEDHSWHHFAFVISSESFTVYHDGMAIQEAECGGQTNFDTDIVYGFRHMNSSHDYHWGGHMAQAGVWNRPLNPEEVLELYLTATLVEGCLEPQACNYDEAANVHDPSTCIYPLVGGNCQAGAVACGEGMFWDATLQACIIANPSDTDFDGCVGMTDLLDLLSSFGTCVEAPEVPWACGDPLEYQGFDYATVQIEGQCWFAENLRSETYLNGDSIPANLTAEDWMTTAGGAVAVYGEGASNCESYSPADQACDETWSLSEYGRLYNLPAVLDARGLCPSGWHVPTDGEWWDVVNNLGGPDIAGELMKATYGWSLDGNGSNGIDLSGFTALPAGNRNVVYGGFGGAGKNTIWWSSTPYSYGAWVRYLLWDDVKVGRSYDSSGGGKSIRCIQDSE